MNLCFAGVILSLCQGLELQSHPKALPLDPFVSSTIGVNFLAVDGRGRVAIAGVHSKFVYLYSDSGKQLGRLELASRPSDITFMRQKDTLAICEPNKGIIVWNLKNKTTLLHAMENCNSIARSPKCDMIAVVGDKSVAIYPKGLRDHPIPIQSKLHLYPNVCFSPDGSLLAIGSARQLLVFDTKSLKEPKFDFFTPTAIQSIAFVGQTHVVVGGDEGLYAHSLKGSDTPPVRLHKHPIFSIAYSDKSKMLGAIDNKKTILLFDASLERRQVNTTPTQPCLLATCKSNSFYVGYGDPYQASYEFDILENGVLIKPWPGKVERLLYKIK